MCSLQMRKKSSEYKRQKKEGSSDDELVIGLAGSQASLGINLKDDFSPIAMNIQENSSQAQFKQIFLLKFCMNLPLIMYTSGGGFCPHSDYLYVVDLKIEGTAPTTRFATRSFLNMHLLFANDVHHLVQVGSFEGWSGSGRARVAPSRLMKLLGFPFTRNPRSCSVTRKKWFLLPEELGSWTWDIVQFSSGGTAGAERGLMCQQTATPGLAYNSGRKAGGKHIQQPDASDIHHCSYPKRQSAKMVDSKDARMSMNQAQ
ncbi:MAG: hypothetical protein Q9210_002750 [Variospora velana]